MSEHLMQMEWLKCPRCESPDLETSELQSELDSVWRTVTCARCGKKWNEVFGFSFNEDYETQTRLDFSGNPII